MTATMTKTQPIIIVGVDAHKDTHHVVVLTNIGTRLADKEFPANSSGYREMLDWSQGSV